MASVCSPDPGCLSDVDLYEAGGFLHTPRSIAIASSTWPALTYVLCGNVAVRDMAPTRVPGDSWSAGHGL